jgi:histidine triad (HIT) family protein
MLKAFAVHLYARIAPLVSNMTPCIFCRIVAGEAPAAVVYRDDLATAFRDIHPVAPTHILIVPNRHITSLNDLTAEDERLIGHLISTARRIAADEGVDRGGYRIILNTGAHGGQTVYHLHLHLIGGQHMRHPIG